MQTLKGFRDFLPQEKSQRDFVTKKIKKVFEDFGFAPLQTPTLEYASLLLGKYGDEADKLVYSFKDRGDRAIALRYDQTVPTSRVLAQYQSQLPRYFRRYQVQSVFRADKPQAGRYREFTQCDIDIFGSTSPLADAEILTTTYFALREIGFKQIELRVNDRQVLFAALKAFTTESVDLFSLVQSIDKLDKLSEEEVAQELIKKGLSSDQAGAALGAINQASVSENLQQIIENAQELGIPEKSLVFTPTLARGLDYYTGMIFEIILPKYRGGSVGGGGRYDNLIKQLSGNDIPAVGVGLGFDRIVEAALQLDLLPQKISNTQILVTIFGEEFQKTALQATKQLRQAEIRTELYPAVDDLRKQFKKADQASIPYTLIIGEEEAAQNKVSLKNMQTGKQELVSLDRVIEKLKEI